MNPFLSEAGKRAVFPSGELWGFGDSVCIGLVMHAHDGCYAMEGAPFVDHHFIIEDFLNKINYYFGE